MDKVIIFPIDLDNPIKRPKILAQVLAQIFAKFKQKKKEKFGC